MPHKNLQKRKRYHREWEHKNPDKKRNYYIRFWSKPENRKKRLIYNQLYRQSPKGIYLVLRNREKYEGRSKVKISQKKFLQWYKIQERKCGYCEIPEELMKKSDLFQRGTSHKRLEIDRKDNLKAYEIDNLILSCPLCNVVKNAILSFSEMKIVAQKYIKPKWKNLIKD